MVSRAAATEDYAITPATHAADGGFEGLLIALVPGAHNTLTQTPGLFALSGLSGLGNSTYLFDRTGTMRAEFQAGDSAGHRFQLVDGQLVLPTGSRRISVIDHLGRATTTIDTGRQSIHHDLVVVGGIAYALTSDLDADEVEDRVIRVDLATGEVDEVVDMKQLLPAYEALTSLDEGEAGGTEATGKDWIHLNTVDVVDGIMYLSSRETAGTFTQDLAGEVPCSAVVSSVFRLGDGGITSPLVVNSGRANVFSERTADGEVLATYRYDSAGYGYRVYKDAFTGFWFA